MPDIYMGNQNVEADSISSMHNKIFCQKCSLASAGALQSISIYIDTTYECNMRMCVYADSSGSPGALQAETDVWLVTATGWNTRATLTNPNLAAGDYWLAFKYPTDDLVIPRTTESGSTKRRTLTYAAGSFPDPAGSPWTYETMLLSWYATLTPAATGNWPLLTMKNELYNTMNSQLRG